MGKRVLRDTITLREALWDPLALLHMSETLANPFTLPFCRSRSLRRPAGAGWEPEAQAFLGVLD